MEKEAIRKSIMTRSLERKEKNFNVLNGMGKNKRFLLNPFLSYKKKSLGKELLRIYSHCGTYNYCKNFLSILQCFTLLLLKVDAWVLVWRENINLEHEALLWHLY